MTGATARDETTDYGTTDLTESRRYGKGLAGARPSMRTPLRETYSRRFEFIRGSRFLPSPGGCPNAPWFARRANAPLFK